MDSWGGTMEEREGAIWVTNPPEPLWPDDGSPRLELELEQVFGADEAPEEAMLASVRDIAVDDSGRVYILDQGDNRLVAFTSSGEFLWSDGRHGEGPGDIQNPEALVWNGAGRLYVANQDGTRLDTWSTDGRYLDTLRLADLGIGTVRTLGFLPPSTVVVLGFPRAQTDGHTLTVAEEWELDDSFVLAASRDVPQPGRTSVGGDSRVTGNAIVFGSVFDYEFRTFRTDGRPDRVVVRSGTDFVPAAIDLERGAIGSLGSTGAPVQLEDGRWLTLASWPTNVEDPIAYLRRATAGERVALHWEHHLDLFDAEGRWLTGRVWEHPDRPPFGSLEMVGPDGRIYTSTDDPFPQVRRYRLVLRTPGQ